MKSIGTQRSIALMHSLSATHARQVDTLPRCVAVHVYLDGSQLFVPHALSSSTVHSTHSCATASQAAVAGRCVQSAPVVQPAQR